MISYIENAESFEWTHGNFCEKAVPPTLPHVQILQLSLELELRAFHGLAFLITKQHSKIDCQHTRDWLWIEKILNVKLNSIYNKQK